MQTVHMIHKQLSFNLNSDMHQTFGAIKEQCVLNVQHTTKTPTLKYGCLQINLE